MGFDEIRDTLKKRRSRKKGHDFERWIAEKLRPIFPRARRHLEFHRLDANGVDLQETGIYKIQCKRFAKYAPIACIQEVKCAEELGDVPVLITAGDELPPLVVIPLDEFIRLVKVDLASG